MLLQLIPVRVFRETPKAWFFDAGVNESNSVDVFIHYKNAIFPTNDANFEQYYIHRQIDRNLVIEGSQKFTLINPKLNEPHLVIFFKRAMGALQIPIGTYHRSESWKEGSIGLSQATRDNTFNQTKEFSPVSLRSNK